MTVKTMTARYAGACNNCPHAVKAGETIRYAGRGLVSHAECGDPAAPAEGTVRAATAPYRGRRSAPPRGYTRGYGRCEDAPCCGCC